MNKRLRQLIAIIYGLIISLFTLQNSYAVDLSLNPTVLKLEVFPGEIKEFSLKITNNEKEEVRFRCYVTDIIPTDGEIDIASEEAAGESKWSCAKWVKIDYPEFTIEGEKEKEIKGKLIVPADSVGGRYAAIVCEEIRKDDEDEEVQDTSLIAIKLKMEIACIIELTINGTGQKEDLKITHIDSQATSEGWGFNIFVKNKGNIHVPATGICFIMDEKGRFIGRENLSSSIGSNPILPDETCKYTMSLKKTLPKGTYTVVARLYYGRGRSVEEKGDFVSEGILSNLKQKKNWKGKDIPFCLVSQPALDLKLLPERFANEVITLKNIRDEQVHVKIAVKDLEITQSGEIVFIEPNNNPVSAVSWIQVQPLELVIPQGEERRINVSFRIPKDVKGNYYASILFDISTIDGLHSSNNSLILIQTSDKVEKKVEVVDFEAKLQEEKKGIDFSVILENKGNVHLQPSCYFILRNNDRLIEQMTIVEKGDIMLLPCGKRRLSFSVVEENNPLPKGLYDATLIIKCAGIQPIKITKEFNLGEGE